MERKSKSLVFYDGTCGLCDRIVQLLLKADTQQQFVFAPLQGETAANYLSELPAKYKQMDSLILIEHYNSDHPRIFVQAKGALRIAWLLGGFWALLGSLSFLPSFLFDWSYRLVARNRHLFFSQDQCILPKAEFKNRFLP